MKNYILEKLQNLNYDTVKVNNSIKMETYSKENSILMNQNEECTLMQMATDTQGRSKATSGTG